MMWPNVHQGYRSHNGLLTFSLPHLDSSIIWIIGLHSTLYTDTGSNLFSFDFISHLRFESTDFAQAAIDQSRVD